MSLYVIPQTNQNSWTLSVCNEHHIQFMKDGLYKKGTCLKFQCSQLTMQGRSVTVLSMKKLIIPNVAFIKCQIFELIVLIIIPIGNFLTFSHFRVYIIKQLQLASYNYAWFQLNSVSRSTLTIPVYHSFLMNDHK